MLTTNVVSSKRARLGEAARLFADFMASDDVNICVPLVTFEYLNGACLDIQESAQAQRSGYSQLRHEVQQLKAEIRRRKEPKQAAMANGPHHNKKKRRKIKEEDM